MFRSDHTQPQPQPVYCCQADGMVGLGCGARSYTRSLHYSNEYAVNAGTTLNVLDPQRSLVVDVFLCEDGHAQEWSLLPQVLERVQAKQV